MLSIGLRHHTRLLHQSVHRLNNTSFQSLDTLSNLATQAGYIVS